MADKLQPVDINNAAAGDRTARGGDQMADSLNLPKIKDETFHKILEKNVNRLDGLDGYRRKARYSPSEKRLYLERWRDDRNRVLEQNAREYAANKGRYRNRNDMVGAYPMNIPADDWDCIMRSVEQIAGRRFEQLPAEEQKKIMKNLYALHPEYRTG